MAFAVKNHVLHRDDKTVAQAPTPNVGGALKPTLLVMHRHDDIAPTRKRDPGPALRMDSFVSRVFGRK